jgi:hypothetical protein
MVTVSSLQGQRLRQSGAAPIYGVATNIYCRRVQRELPVGQIRQTLFEPKNSSCTLCKEGNGGQFPCQAKQT